MKISESHDHHDGGSHVTAESSIQGASRSLCQVQLRSARADFDGLHFSAELFIVPCHNLKVLFTNLYPVSLMCSLMAVGVRLGFKCSLMRVVKVLPVSPT